MDRSVVGNDAAVRVPACMLCDSPVLGGPDALCRQCRADLREIFRERSY